MSKLQGHEKGQGEGLRELALFAGAGGGILGGHLLGWNCVCAVEWEPYPAGVLIARQNEGILPPFPIWDDVQTFDGKPWRGLVDVVSGGFPCQDISAAGKGAGIEGERSGMWSHMARIIGEVRPRYVLVENSPVLTSRGLGVVLGDLAALGYDAEWGVLGAVHAGAPHNRERIWIVAYSKDSSGRDRGAKRFGRRPLSRRRGQVGREWNHAGHVDIEGSCEQSSVNEGQHPIGHVANGNLCGRLHGQVAEQPAEGRVDAQREPEPSGTYVADPASIGQQGSREHVRPIHSAAHRDRKADWANDSSKGTSGWWITEPNVGRVANGVAAILDILRENAYLRLSTMAR